MTKIIRARETMTSKERVLRTFAHEKTDRVTIGYEANPAIHARVAHALCIADESMDKVRDALGVDYRGVNPAYTGKPLFEEKPGLSVNPLEGCYMRYVSHETGGYWDFCEFPLKDASDALFESYPVPSPDDFDYDGALEQCKALGDYGMYTGGAGVPDVINSNGRIMGMEDVLIHLFNGDGAAMDFIKRRADFQYGMLERTLDKCGDYIDFVWLGEDLGTQRGPMISLELYRETIKPVHSRFVGLAASYGKPVIVHCCGSSSWAFEDFIEMGVSAVDTLQPEAADMSPQYLKKTFGNRLGYRGCISTAGALATGTPEDVRETVKSTLEIMMDGGGYNFAPTHQIQDNTPVENVFAMYQAAHDYGVY